MANQVSARLLGDNYQIRFFWLQAASMLKSDSKIEKVGLERDNIAVVDDVIVYYKPPGIKDCNEYVLVDFFQIKYHVTQRGHLSVDNLLNPSFIGTKESLFQRIYNTYLILKGKGYNNFRLNIVTNYSWKSDEKIRNVIDAEGNLRQEFFNAGKRSDLGKIRINFSDHLGIKENEIIPFLKTLRFHSNFLSANYLNNYLSDILELVGLKAIDFSKQSSIYDDLGRKFIINKIQVLDKKILWEICKQEKLVAIKEISKPSRIGIASFKGYTEQIYLDCNKYIDLCEYFNGRYIKSKKDWNSTIPNILKDFLSQKSLSSLSKPIEIRINSHMSIAFMAGYFLDSKSGIDVYPLQNTIGKGLAPWSNKQVSSKYKWIIEKTNEGNSNDLAIAVSITHNTKQKVCDFINSKNKKFILAHLNINNKTGPQLIEDGKHAWSLVCELQKIVLNLKKTHSSKCIHFFIAAPNAFIFMLGQLSHVFGKVIFYDYDFDESIIRSGGYYKTIILPIN